MKTCINIQDIDLLCNDSQTVSSYNCEAKFGCDKQIIQSSKSEPKPERGKKSVFECKVVEYWDMIKEFTSGVVDVLKTATKLIGAVTGLVKGFRKLGSVFA